MLFFVGINYSCTLSLHLRINSIFMKIPRANSCLVDSFLTPKIIFFLFSCFVAKCGRKKFVSLPKRLYACFFLPSRLRAEKKKKLLVGHQYCDCRKKRRRGDGRRRRRRRKLMSFITLTTIATHKRERKKALNFSKMSSHRWWLLNLLLPCRHISPIYERFHPHQMIFPFTSSSILDFDFLEEKWKFSATKILFIVFFISFYCSLVLLLPLLSLSVSLTFTNRSNFCLSVCLEIFFNFSLHSKIFGKSKGKGFENLWDIKFHDKSHHNRNSWGFYLSSS